MTETRSTIETYWAAADARDWETFGTTLADDVVYELPQTRERIHGREAYVRFNVEYPGDWHLAIARVIADGNDGVSWVRFTVDGAEQPAVTFFRLDTTGRIAEITDFWPEAYDPPAGREHLVERY